ncbi:hypothetical protein PsYK624_171070 [Phanerochaete sordida]|uniref:Uncharacterized protein n=1 Tax=Phanerochaete sordida TaxID=48140 RepID=A0A9P3GS04_9APHY|nr:hypothetical protein PsYK624_171070 [Phanerochaete sordida]
MKRKISGHSRPGIDESANTKLRMRRSRIKTLVAMDRLKSSNLDVDDSDDEDLHGETADIGEGSPLELSLPFLDEVETRYPANPVQDPDILLEKATIATLPRPLTGEDLRRCFGTCQRCKDSYLITAVHDCNHAPWGDIMWFSTKKEFLDAWTKCELCGLFLAKDSFTAHEETCPKIAIDVQEHQ